MPELPEVEQARRDAVRPLRELANLDLGQQWTDSVTDLVNDPERLGRALWIVGGHDGDPDAWASEFTGAVMHDAIEAFWIACANFCLPLKLAENFRKSFQTNLNQAIRKATQSGESSESAGSSPVVSDSIPASVPTAN